MPAAVRGLKKALKRSRSVKKRSKILLVCDFQKSVPVQRREDAVEVVVILYEVVIEIRKELRCDLPDRFRGDDDVVLSVVECHGKLQWR